MITYLWFFFENTAGCSGGVAGVFIFLTFVHALCSLTCFYLSQSWCEWSGDKSGVWDDCRDLCFSWRTGVRHRDSEDQSCWTAALQSPWNTHTSRWVGLYKCFRYNVLSTKCTAVINHLAILHEWNVKETLPYMHIFVFAGFVRQKYRFYLRRFCQTLYVHCSSCPAYTHPHHRSNTHKQHHRRTGASRSVDR